MPNQSKITPEQFKKDFKEREARFFRKLKRTMRKLQKDKKLQEEMEKEIHRTLGKH